MLGKVVLLTGVPASGKTTLAKKLEDVVFPLRVITFGEMIYELKRKRNAKVSYENLRERPSREATLKLIEDATSLLHRRVRQLRRSTNIVIDSHAVAKDHFGFRITPDSYSSLQKLELDSILVLHAKPQDIVDRINHDAAGRRKSDISEVITHQRLQDSVAVAYAVSSGCPVFIINVYGDLNQTLDEIVDIFGLIGMNFRKKEGKHD